MSLGVIQNLYQLFVKNDQINICIDVTILLPENSKNCGSGNWAGECKGKIELGLEPRVSEQHFTPRTCAVKVKEF